VCPEGRLTASGTMLYATDYLGSVRAVVGGYNGTVYEKSNYSAYGSRIVKSSVTPPSGITLRDHYTGCEDLAPDFSIPYADHSARFYSPALHRWMVPDPKSEDYYGVSVYAYCGGNPMNETDPSGLNPIYDNKGNFLGTDDSGLQGNYIIMDAKIFVQGMSHKSAEEHSYTGKIETNVENAIAAHFQNLASRPDYDGFISIWEGVKWAKDHPYALQNPSPDNTLYVDASQLDFGSLSKSDFSGDGETKSINLFNKENTRHSIKNRKLRSTVYALGVFHIKILNREKGTVQIVNDDATKYDWNTGGTKDRNRAIHINNFIFGINPSKHGFNTFYYGVGELNQ